jgi:hypothetical protein
MVVGSDLERQFLVLVMYQKGDLLVEKEDQLLLKEDLLLLRC